jgi:hypothetical protein
MKRNSVLLAYFHPSYKVFQERVIKELQLLHKADFIEYHRGNHNLLLEGARVNKDTSSFV